jgi:hypothetical protein
MSGSEFIQDNIGDKKTLLSALEKNMSWIKKSFSVNNDLGSSKYCTLWGKWSIDYPETTGYLLTTLIRSGDTLNDLSLIKIASLQINYFENLQLKTGGFKVAKSLQESYVFDSAQIMLGLISVYKVNKEARILKMIESCYRWLISLLNQNGQFVSSNYKKNYNPSYYARILWPILLAERLLSTGSNKTLNLYAYLKSLLNENGSFNKCSFDGSPFAFTHNLIYSYRGLWESSNLLNDKDFGKNLENQLLSISDKIIKDNFFNGEYDAEWKTKKSFICSAGNAQLVVLLLSIYKRTRDLNLLNCCHVLMPPLIKQQSKGFLYNKGALSSSIPIWGKYQRFRYTNWTQKFYADALIELISFLPS